MPLRYVYFGLTVLASVVFLWAVLGDNAGRFPGPMIDHIEADCQYLARLLKAFEVYMVAVVCIWSHALLWRR